MTDRINECTKTRSKAREIIFHERNFTLTFISAKHREGTEQKRIRFFGGERRKEKKKSEQSGFPSGHRCGRRENGQFAVQSAALSSDYLSNWPVWETLIS